MRLAEWMKQRWRQTKPQTSSNHRFDKQTNPRNQDQDAEGEGLDPFNPFSEPVVIPFTDVLDLHYIPADKVKIVVQEFITAAQTTGYRHIRIIHGKGISVQREIVRGILAKTPGIVHFSDAPPEAGGWGATVAELAAKAE